MVGSIAIAAILRSNVRKPNVRKPTFETFGFRMDSDFEWSEFEPPLYLFLSIGIQIIARIMNISPTIQIEPQVHFEKNLSI